MCENDPRYRLARAEGWDAARKQLWSEIRGLPSWTNPVTRETGFDLQPLGADGSSEEGARALVVEIFNSAVNPFKGDD